MSPACFYNKMFYTLIMITIQIKTTMFVVLLLVLVVCPAMSKGVVQDGLCKVFLAQEQGKRYLFTVDMQQNNQSDGVAFQFYPFGDIEKIAWYADGVLHGTYRSFWKTGDERIVINYQHGKQVTSK